MWWSITFTGNANFIFSSFCMYWLLDGCLVATKELSTQHFLLCGTLNNVNFEMISNLCLFLSSKIFCDRHATHFTIFCCIPKLSAYTVLGKKKECPLNLNLKIFCTASFWLELHCNALVNWLQPFFLAIITNLPNFIQFWKKNA